MLCKDPRQRATLADVIAHPWMRRSGKHLLPHQPTTPSPHPAHSAGVLSPHALDTTRQLATPQPSLPEAHAVWGGADEKRVRTASHLVGDVSPPEIYGVHSAERSQHKHARNVGAALGRLLHWSED